MKMLTVKKRINLRMIKDKDYNKEHQVNEVSAWWNLTRNNIKWRHTHVGQTTDRFRGIVGM